MSAITFDTHRFVRRLVAEGATEKAAQAHVEALQEALDNHAHSTTGQNATKDDVNRMETRLELLGKDVNLLRNDMTWLKWALGMILAGVASLVIKASAG